MNTLAQKYGKGVFAKHLENYQPQDPLYETYQDSAGRQKRRKREVPPGLSKRDEKILKSVKRRAHYLDKGFSLCGFRFGWTFIIGFIPIVGDVVDASLNYYLVVRKARKAELPGWLVQRMLLNNTISAAIGFVPIVGDVILAAYKANSRNAWLLDEYLRIRGEEMLKAKAVRSEDVSVVKPGAGMEEGETVKGKKTGTVKSLGSIWKKKAVAPTPAPSTGEASTAGAGSTNMPGSLKGKGTLKK
ncbi:hypothetical protein EXIGLDRAFT_724341 [Exidia glandulosa HHB12029]|uniref:DUF4112 domain-containing protein n=1 Tax=Exidia glandulosa HHB12029 TaxID=1314781 RepID=A0A165EGZ9_EXIGL|nr:hypothetical protein EXIGLDRAFT_724341 [Exidia glandulosa HHB12029]